MTKNELLNEVLRGVLVIVGEYRGSHAEEAGYIDKKFGNAIRYIRATHLVECAWHGHIDRVIVTERFPEQITTVEQAQATFTYSRGGRYVFYIDWFKRERGQTYASLSGWGIEEIEDAREAVGAPTGGPPPP
jgi:hypothetical protein